MSNKFVFEAGIQTPAQKRAHMQALANDPCYLVNSDIAVAKAVRTSIVGAGLC